MVPFSDSNNILILRTPTWLRLIIFISELSVILFGWNNLLNLANNPNASVVFIVLFFIINPFLHEKCHAFVYNELTGNKATISFANCRFNKPCTVAQFRLTLLSPLFIVALYGIVLGVLIWLQCPLILVQLTALGVIVALFGICGDFYWLFLLRKIKPSYLVIDEGVSARVYKDIS